MAADGRCLVAARSGADVQIVCQSRVVMGAYCAKVDAELDDPDAPLNFGASSNFDGDRLNKLAQKVSTFFGVRQGKETLSCQKDPPDHDDHDDHDAMTIMSDGGEEGNPQVDASNHTDGTVEDMVGWRRKRGMGGRMYGASHWEFPFRRCAEGLREKLMGWFVLTDEARKERQEHCDQGKARGPSRRWQRKRSTRSW